MSDRRRKLRGVLQASAQRKAQIAVPGWKVLRLTNSLWLTPRPTPKPSTRARRSSARRLQKKARRERPGHDSQCGSQLSENLRLIEPTSSPGADSSLASEMVGSAGLEGEKMLTLLKTDFRGAEDGVSHSGTWWMAGTLVDAIVYYG